MMQTYCVFQLVGAVTGHLQVYFFFIKEYKDKYFSVFKLLWINAWSTDRASGSLGEKSLSLKVPISGIVKLIFVSQSLNSVSFYCLFFSPCPVVVLLSVFHLSPSSHLHCNPVIILSADVYTYQTNPLLFSEGGPSHSIPVSLFLPAYFCLNQFVLLYI